nr:uncharacterized protein LOC129274311 [Lytechinus pictus]
MADNAASRKRRSAEAALDDELLQEESPTKKVKDIAEDEEELDEDALLGNSDGEENLDDTGFTDAQNYNLEEEVGLEEEEYGEEAAGLLEEQTGEEFGGEYHAEEYAEGDEAFTGGDYVEGEGEEYVEGAEGEGYAEGGEEYAEGGGEQWNEGEGAEEWQEGEAAEETWHEEQDAQEELQEEVNASEGLELFDDTGDVLDIDIPDDSLVDDLNVTAENQSFASQASVNDPVSSTPLTTPKNEKPKPGPPREEEETSLVDADTTGQEEEDEEDTETEKTTQDTEETSESEEEKEDEDGRGGRFKSERQTVMVSLKSTRTRNIPDTLGKLEFYSGGAIIPI